MKKILDFPLTKIIIGLAVCLSIGLAGQAATNKLLENSALSREKIELISSWVLAILVLVSYEILFRFYEKRKISELSTNNLFFHATAGILLGLILQSMIIFVMYLNKDFRIISVNKFSEVLPYLAFWLAAATTVEILFLGVIFRIIEEKLGSWLSLILFVIIFGALHYFTPNGNLIASFAIAMHAGFLLGAAYIYSRNLWFPIAIHFAWDFVQTRIFGATVNGSIMDKSLLTTKIEGSKIITGGYFGPHGSLQGGLFCLIAGALLMKLSQKQHKIIKPYWKMGVR
jgi:membrane protease YdiL (CAAX protease family)